MSQNFLQSLHNQALLLVPEFGFSEKTLREACKKLGRAEIDFRLAFDGGVIDWISYYLDWLDDELIAQAKNLPLAEMKIRSRIHSLVMLRISLLQHEKNISRKLLATLSTPAYFSFSAKRVWKTADIIWRLAGDSATDFNHYSKRALLSGVYSSTLLYWLQDESEKYCKTVTFLERRIAEVISFGQKSKTARDNIKDFFPPILKQAFSHE